MALRTWSCALTVLLMLGGCAQHAPRPAQSSYACMRAVHDSLPPDLPDKRAHCLAAGLIARRCSIIEAYMAGAGKELRDLAGPGDAQWADWQADRLGIRCARRAITDDDVDACCAGIGSSDP